MTISFPSYIIIVIITVPTSQSEVTVIQSDDNQPRQDDESSPVENTKGLYMCGILRCIVTLKECL